MKVRFVKDHEDGDARHTWELVEQQHVEHTLLNHQESWTGEGFHHEDGSNKTVHATVLISLWK